ncbi:MAG TPA: branched-chain amino acid ABC transporter substrate-binding protein [Candidatus Limnocylindrales bacterium]|nr:branched-chain amino acid ABC transporter substrate-binding protein [Candidatus Limnocylindrales bacterium]
MKTARVLLVMAVALALALPLTSLTEAQSKGTIKIATQSPLSGGQAALGEGIKLGTQLAIDKMKGPIEKAGFKVELVPFDDQAKPDVGVANAANIIADKDIMLVVGHLNSGVAIPASEKYKEAQLAMVSPANTNPTITDRNYLNVSRVCGRDDVQGSVGAEFAKSKGWKTAYVIHDKTTYGQGVAEFFKAEAEKKGIKVIGFEGTEEKSNFDPIITPIKARNPDLIYFGGIYDQAAPFFKQAREKGVKSTFMGPDGMDSSDLTKIAGKAVQGMFYTSVAGPVTVYPQAKAFAKEYKDKFKKDPEPFAAQAYDSAAIGLKAIEAAIKASGGKLPSREQVSVAIRKTKHNGLTGAVEFDDKGDPKKAKYFVLQVTSDDPAKWGDNKPIKTLEIAAPPLKKS